MTAGLSKLFYGDNLPLLRSMQSSSIDLVYLDPPFNSDRVYNVNMAAAGDAAAQIHAFDDTWRWSNETSATYDELVLNGGLPPLPTEALAAVRALVKESPLTAYMTAMAPRLVELHRVLKDTGSLFLHCDPTASHYLKVMLDAIFGPAQFRNEIIWRRTGGHSPGKSFGPIHDTILFYAKSKSSYFKPTYRPYTTEHVRQRYTQQDDGQLKFTSGGNVLTGAGSGSGESSQPWRGFDPSAKHRHWAVPGFVAEQMPEGFAELGPLAQLEAAYNAGLIEIIPGRAWPEPVRYLTAGVGGERIPDIWAYQPGTKGVLFGTDAPIDADVAYLGPTSPERLGYPTQKPRGLLGRIIEAACPPEGTVLDPFCGCGTTIDAAIRAHRRWIGIDITYLAIDLIRNRLEDVFGSEINATYEVLGVPADLAAAHALFAKNPLDFERWAVSMVRGTPNKKQVGDHGADGSIAFYRGPRMRNGKVIVSVKGGRSLAPTMVRDLGGVVAQDSSASGGVLVTGWEPTRGMRQAAETSGTFLDPAGNHYPLLQIITVEELLDGRKPNLPTVVPPYAEALPARAELVEQALFDLD